MEKLPRVYAMKIKVLTAVLLLSLALNVVIGAIIAFRIVFIGGEHGTAWLSIGPALFSECKRIEWFHGYRKKIETGKPVTHEGKDGVVWTEMDLKNPNIE